MWIFDLIQFDVLQRNEYNRQTPGLKGGSDDGKAVCNVSTFPPFDNLVTGMIVTSTDAIRVLQM